MKIPMYLIMLTSVAFVTQVNALELNNRSRQRHMLEIDSLHHTQYIEFETTTTRFDSAGLDSFIQYVMQTQHIPGVTTCAIKNGQIIWTGAHGTAIIGPINVEAADTTLFMLASISKTITGVALMQLWEQGLFGLDEDINNHLPFAVHNPNHPDSVITFRHLLTHTSSINDNWAMMPYFPGDAPIPLGEYMQEYLVPGGTYFDSLNYNSWPPCAHWEYCNIAVALAGYLVEVIADSFPIHCQDSIFTPLDMYETSWFLAGLDTNNIAMPYHWNGSNYIPYGHYGYPDYPNGQLRTSSIQLARFLTAFQQYGQIDTVRILDSTTVELMTTIQYPLLNSNQGLIWFKMLLSGLRWIWGHSGGDQGVSTAMFYCPAETTAAIVLNNGESYTAGTRRILDALFAYAAEYGVEERRNISVTLNDLSLSQNFPNPFNQSTSIDFVLSRNSHVNLTVYNVVGQKVSVLVDAELQAGEHSIVFNVQGLPSGVYHYRLDVGGSSKTKRCVLLK